MYFICSGYSKSKNAWALCTFKISDSSPNLSGILNIICDQNQLGGAIEGMMHVAQQIILISEPFKIMGY